ncbi:hypothetical protein [Deinococcus sp.]|uniref:hypothetical protein n=1 Tax=Deinococcus sp. TaxID=47478 RepID=UPI003C7BA6FF
MDGREGGMEDEGAMVYPDDLDEAGWPQTPAEDPRFLICDGQVKRQALSWLWEPFGRVHDLAFEELDIEDVAPSHLPLLRQAIASLLLQEGMPDLAPDLAAYLTRLEVFVADLERQGKGLTVSL